MEFEQNGETEPSLYMVTADIVGVTETPGLTYEREAHAIPYTDGLEGVLIYGNIVKAVPLAEGKFAGLWAEAFHEDGDAFGYVDMTALAPLPEIEFFPAPEPFRFAVDSPQFFLLPGSISLLDYTLPGDEPYYVLAGEVVEGVGTFRDAAGLDWTLMRFFTRHA